MDYMKFNKLMRQAKQERFWNDVAEEVEYSYFQEELYGVRKVKSPEVITFVRATSPQEAIEKYLDDHKVINIKHIGTLNL